MVIVGSATVRVKFPRTLLDVTMVQQSGRPAPRAIILVAGMGSRLGEHAANRPKCLVEVNGTPILVNALDRLERAGVGETVLVVGYRASEIRQRIGQRLRAMRISYRENGAFARTNTTRSLHVGLDGHDGDTLVLEGDVYFDQRVIDHFLSVRLPDVTSVELWRPDLDGSVVTLAPDGTVSAWVHKKDRPAGFTAEGTFKTVNLHRFSEHFVRTWLAPALAAHVAADGGREPIETVFASIVQQGGRIHAVEVQGSWVEIDTESDLRAAEALF
jgi:choline kinase